MIPILTKNERTLEAHVREACVVLINKPENWTSFDVVNKIRRALKIKKVGHAGTLDPFATGLLIVGLGKGTRALQEFMNLEKEYRALIKLGVETDTYDVTGKLVREQSVEHLTITDVERVVSEMQGEILQTPPMFSAKKVNGVPLYKLARKGKTVERKPQKVTVFRANILDWQPPLLEMELKVSKGTYIRSYAHDLGKKLGVGGCLQKLERTAIGDFTVQQSFELDAFIEFWKQNVGQMS